MVNINAIKSIMRFVSQNKIKPMIKWSDRVNNKNSLHLSILKRSTRKLLELLSGNDTLSMLKSILTKEELNTLAPDKYKKVLQNLSEHYETVDLKQRHNIIRPIRNAGFSFQSTRNFGFKISKTLWKTCLNNEPRNLGGGRDIDIDIKESIKLYLKNHSRMSANRLVTDKSDLIKVPIRYLDDSKIELYKNFPNKHLISKSTFLKYISADSRYKKIQRKTDVCDFCDWLRIKSKSIKDIITHFPDYKLSVNFNPNDLIDFLNRKKNESQNSDRSNEIDSFIELLRNYEAVIEHKKHASAQRDAYNAQRKDKEFLRNKIFIDIDFKQKIIIGLSPIQPNSEFYNLENRTCLGFGITYLEDESIETINFDMISKCYKGSQDAHSVVRAFRILRKQVFFQNIEKSEYVIWADCGKHFRNSLVVGYLFKELRNSEKHVTLQFFGEKHGKNSRDAHFACLSYFIRSQSLLGRLKNSKDVVDAITNGQRKSNENREMKSLPPIKTIAYELTDAAAEELDQERNDLGVEELHKLKIDHLESRYCYRTAGEEYIVESSVLSNSEEYLPIETKVEELETKVENHNNLAEKDYVNPEIRAITFENLRKKNQFIRLALVNIATKLSNHAKIREDFEKNMDTYTPTTTPEIPATFIPGLLIREISAVEGMEVTAVESQQVETNDCYGRDHKKDCHKCNAVCRYSLDELRDKKFRPKQKNLRAELVSHNHPSTRTIGESKRQANTQEQCDELINHYRYSHHI